MCIFFKVKTRREIKSSADNIPTHKFSISKQIIVGTL